MADVIIPRLTWGFAVHSERLHDRNKGAWWLLLFYVVPGLLGHFAKAAWFAEGAGVVLHYVPALASFALTICRFVEISYQRGTAGPNRYGSIPLARCATRSALPQHADISTETPENKKSPMAVLATGRVSFGVEFPHLILIDLCLPNLHRQTFT